MNQVFPDSLSAQRASTRPICAVVFRKRGDVTNFSTRTHPSKLPDTQSRIRANSVESTRGPSVVVGRCCIGRPRLLLLYPSLAGSRHSREIAPEAEIQA